MYLIVFEFGLRRPGNLNRYLRHVVRQEYLFAMTALHEMRCLVDPMAPRFSLVAGMCFLVAPNARIREDDVHFSCVVIMTLAIVPFYLPTCL